MNRVELISRVQRYFDLRELVDEPTFRKYGTFAWNFFDTALLETLLKLREDILKVPMTINDWYRGGRFSERGLRHNLSAEVQKKTRQNSQYMTAHMTGKGFDFDARGMTAEQVRRKIIAEGGKLPHPIRLEKDVNWVHADIYNDGSVTKVLQFKA